jgi:glutamate synthase (NADPH/NADH) large chain
MFLGQRRPISKEDAMTQIYDPQGEHDACGVGMVANLDAIPRASTVSDALTILENLEHRGATGSDPDSGDGAGILLQLPHAFLTAVTSDLGIALPERGLYGVGQWMLPASQNAEARATIEQACVDTGLQTLGWREVPVDSSILGAASKGSEPIHAMQFVSGDPNWTQDELEYRLYIARKRAARGSSAYASSFSTRTIVYKGMLTSAQLRRYFVDLRDDRLETAIALVHSRFSTNTFPRWELAQPFRFIAHNGEINTVRSNRSWMAARESKFETEKWNNSSDLTPVISPSMSDSASFDEAAELLFMNGRSLPHSILMMIPEAWERATTMDPKKRDFYRFNAALMEPWDGPASVSFCDGTRVGAVLDRNGLRPARYWVTGDRRVIFSSEVGVLDIEPANVIAKGRLQPGRMFLVDIEKGVIVDDADIKAELAGEHPYSAWLDKNQIDLDNLAQQPMLLPEHESLVRLQHLFGYTEEEIRLILTPMARNGEEPIGSMGSDSPIAVLSTKSKPVFDFFTQQFAQVTNPPLDAIREELVTSLRVGIGGHGNLLSATADHVRQIVLSAPVIDLEDLAKIRYIEDSGVGTFKSIAVDGLFDVASAASDPRQSLLDGLKALEDHVVESVRAGVNLVILSDRNSTEIAAPIPSLLQVAAVHNRLVREHLRANTALIVEAGDVKEVHHVALLLGFGASAVCPYLALDTIEELAHYGQFHDEAPGQARYRYNKALSKGVLKVMSKMGVSTIASYIGSQLFEAIGVDQEVVERCFPGIASKIGGRGFAGFAKDVLRRHEIAYGREVDPELETRGEYQWRREGEPHLFNPQTVYTLQHATREGRMDVFRTYTRLIDQQERQRVTLRSFFEIQPLGQPIDISEVEPIESILKRFSTGAMSYGSISPEAHENLAIAMNRMGGKSNTGEGGEDEVRDTFDDPQFNRRSAIKQVASGRFGVTSRYLVNADDLQIKVSQGAKPGEGGQLPGNKVYPWIAKTRHSTPGVGLISPPPHHDIYSIEDLAQLIFDLKNANNQARVHVKLVSEAGVGTVAAGVAKAKADVILISGFDGGTGAAPLTSLKHAGTPWEIGLAETQQTLAANGLRDRVTVQVDGQLKTGRDVLIAALLGAEEYGFATAPLIVSGCVMMRVCHLDTCPVGIATQNPVLRERFTGKPEFVENFFEFIATEIREYLAAMGARSLDEIIGRSDLIAVEESTELRDAGVDFQAILKPPVEGQRLRLQAQDNLLTDSLDWQFLSAAADAAERGVPYRFDGFINNVQRTVGTLTGSEITRRCVRMEEDDQIVLNFEGSAGQSLGSFMPKGLTIQLAGDANDYVGKGLSGGRIVIQPHVDSPFASESNIIAGNVIGYGATSGEIFLRGIVGERLAVRNSGATIVVEGTGDHVAEYMTGGVVVVLGPTGRNVAAGMSGGSAYFYDPDQQLTTNLSAGLFDVDPLEYNDDQFLQNLLARFAAATGSVLAKAMIANWASERMNFVRVQSVEYRKALEAQHGQG